MKGSDILVTSFIKSLNWAWNSAYEPIWEFQLSRLNVFIRRWAKTTWRRESSGVSWKSKNAWIENSQLVGTEPSKLGTLSFKVLDAGPMNQGGSLPPSAKSRPSNWLSLHDGGMWSELTQCGSREMIGAVYETFPFGHQFWIEERQYAQLCPWWKHQWCLC